MADVPFRWTDPSTWPWMFYVWLLFLVAGWVRPAWRWLRRRQVRSWPTVQGRIESATVTRTKQWFSNSVAYRAELEYSYSVEGRAYRGRLRRSFDTDAEASEFIRELAGKAASISFNLANSQSSMLSENSLRTLQESRAPLSEEATLMADAGKIPNWLPGLLWPLIVLSAVGFALSLWVHISVLTGHQPSAAFWGLHVGIFLVFFPAVLVAQKRVGSTSRKDFWKVVLKGAPDSVRYLLYATFAYIAVNGVLAFARGTPFSEGRSVPASEMWRGFSLTWMGFYSASLAILYSAATALEKLPRCVNRHLARPNAAFCERCGQPVLRNHG